MLIGLHGSAGAGKDEAARVIRVAAASRGERCASVNFADRLYAAVSAITGIPVAVLKNREAKEKVIPWIGKSPRQLLQSLGTEWGRKMVLPDLWIRATLEEVRPLLARGFVVTIADVRFDNEAEAILEAGGVVYRVARPGHCCLSADAESHESEAGISAHLIAGEIVNDGTLDDLRQKVVELILKQATV